MSTKVRTTIQVGQRLIYHDGQRGYVSLNSHGQTTYGLGEEFKVTWKDIGGAEWEDYYTLEDFEEEGITWGRGRMRWAL